MTNAELIQMMGPVMEAWGADIKKSFSRIGESGPEIVMPNRRFSSPKKYPNAIPVEYEILEDRKLLPAKSSE